MSILWHITCLLLLRSCTPGFFIHGIVGGKVSVPHSRPYMVYIRDKISQLTCGGFLIREDYVMTAAHCKQSNLMVYLGVSDTNFLPDGIEVDPVPHSKFNMKREGHDIMLLKLKTQATLNKIVGTITLPNPENEEIAKDCMVMGWGWKKYHDESPSNVLKEANGDSGGPLVCGGVAEGIVSVSKTKSNADHLSAYTHISLYYPWIQSIMPLDMPEMLDQLKKCYQLKQELCIFSFSSKLKQL
uniref:trypsin n=1 Tax=Sinocyclocheilus grahami TaxID=75366 RepID=A0A672P3Z6_SINGR